MLCYNVSANATDKEEDCKASQNASKALSRRRHSEVDSARSNNSDGECELRWAFKN